MLDARSISIITSMRLVEIVKFCLISFATDR
jgi:hypothetical protein